MSSQMDFGLFPESKGYRWECRQEQETPEIEEVEDEPDEILTDFLEPAPPVTPHPEKLTLHPPQIRKLPYEQSGGEGWLTTGEAFVQLQARGFEKTTGTLRRWLQPAITTGRLPTELEEFGLEADFTKRQRSNPKDNSVRWLRFKE